MKLEHFLNERLGINKNNEKILNDREHSKSYLKFCMHVPKMKRGSMKISAKMVAKPSRQDGDQDRFYGIY